jgi:methylase of polypeptide subunit release factors
MTTAIRFDELEIVFDQSVLRPRPWTVLQARWAAELLPGLPPGDVLELCAGVGHIGLLALRGAHRRLVQVDASGSACAFARVNAERAGVPAEVRHGSMEEVIGEAERFALVIADPPWVASSEVGRHPEDPRGAIDGGADGLAVVRTCLSVTAGHLGDGGAALLQLGSDAQVDAVAEYVDRHGGLGLRVVDRRVAAEGAVVLLRRSSERSVHRA